MAAQEEEWHSGSDVESSVPYSRGSLRCHVHDACHDHCVDLLSSGDVPCHPTWLQIYLSCGGIVCPIAATTELWRKREPFPFESADMWEQSHPVLTEDRWGVLQHIKSWGRDVAWVRVNAPLHGDSKHLKSVTWSWVPPCGRTSPAVVKSEIGWWRLSFWPQSSEVIWLSWTCLAFGDRISCDNCDRIPIPIVCRSIQH